MASPLFEKAAAVVAAYDDKSAQGDHWADAVDRAMRELRDELAEIDRALGVLERIRSIR